MAKCEYCGAEIELPFQCSFCGDCLCMEHRLPENHSCPSAPARTPLGHWKSKYSSEKSPKGKEAVKINEKEPSRVSHLPSVSWRPRRLLLSLKLWFLVFWVIVGLLFLMERNNPVQFYQSFPDAVKYSLYIFASGIGIWSGYRVFEKCDYNPRSDRGIFALKLLSVGILVVAVLTMMFGIFFYGGLFKTPQLSLARETISTFIIVLSFVLIILSAYLVFKFERRSGIIVYNR